MEDNERMDETLDRGEQEEKRFTQDEVEEIIKKRLARERRKAGQEKDPLAEREHNLTERELRLTAREKLQEEGLPMSLADVLRYADEDTLSNAIETIKNLFTDSEPAKAWGERQSGRGRNPVDSRIRKAMGLDQK